MSSVTPTLRSSAFFDGTVTRPSTVLGGMDAFKFVL